MSARELERPTTRVLVAPEKQRHHRNFCFDELSQNFALRNSSNELFFVSANMFWISFTFYGFISFEVYMVGQGSTVIFSGFRASKELNQVCFRLDDLLPHNPTPTYSTLIK